MIHAARLLLLLLISPTVVAQFNPARSFTLEEENLTPSINVISRIRSGYFLVGTTHGLYKFDGSRFQSIPFQNSEYSDTVTAILEDRSGKTWLGFRSGRIAHIINNVLQFWNPEEGHPKKQVTSFCESPDGAIWFSTNGEGVYYFQNKRLFLVNESNGLKDLHVSSLSIAGNNVIAGTDNGIYFISGSGSAKNATKISVMEGLPDYIVTAIAQSEKGNWLGFHDNGFCFIDNSGKISRPSVTRNWEGGEITAMLYQGKDVWISTRSGDLFRFGTSDSSLTRIATSPSTENLHLLASDVQGNIWAGGGSKILRTAGRSITFYAMPEGTLGDHIHALLYDASGKFWIPDQYNNLVQLSYEHGKTRIRTMKINSLNEKTDITSLYQDKEGKIWIGTMGQGIFIMDTGSLSYSRLDDLEGLNETSILSVTGRKNNIYVSTLQGCFRVKSKDGEYNVEQIDLSRPGQGYIYTVLEDSKGRLWIATDGNGLSLYQNGNLITYDSRSGLKDDRIYSLAEDPSGNIWFSTASAGIYKYSNGQFQNFGLKEGLTNLNISSIKCDAKGNIVIINKTGLDVIHSATGSVFYFNENYGLQTLNVEDLGANTQASNGDIYFISGNNITRYTAGSLMAPKTVLDNVLLFMEPVEGGKDRFDHTENNFTFQYTGVYFSDPEQVFYQYKLEGLDTTWIITRDRNQTFPNLSPGKYIFRVRSSLNRNFTNSSEASFAFEITQAFYKQPWFFVACGIFLLGMFYTIFRAREKRLRKIAEMKNEQERVKFALLRNQVNPHFLFNSFNTLITTIEEDPARAVEYTEQLSDFFRNIVTYRDKDVITLQEEFELLRTYLYLQKKRYGDNLSLSIPDEIPGNFLIPPLTLQLLMENAIKHNAVSRERPLKVKLTYHDQYLEIKNNKNERLSKEKGAGMGLQNIVNRYGMLTSKKVIIKETEKDFSVSLPQINS